MFQNFVQKAYAQSSVPRATTALIQKILDNVVNPIITLMVGIAIIYFLWGVFQFIRNAESPEERKKGGMHMLYSVFGLFLMATAYGVINLILGTLGK